MSTSHLFKSILSFFVFVLLMIGYMFCVLIVVKLIPVFNVTYLDYTASAVIFTLFYINIRKIHKDFEIMIGLKSR